MPSGAPPSPLLPADPIRTALSEFVSWSRELPDWQRDALRRIYTREKLTLADLDELYRLCRQAHNLLEAGETALTSHLLNSSHVPATLNSNDAVALKSLGRTQNVNALAEDQTLQFAETGLTIVYGDNGSGKSGYGRVLKQVCRARNQEEILPNAYSPATGKSSARIKYYIGAVVQPEIAWEDGSATVPALSNISVFDSKCASVHVDGKNELAYTPMPLQILQQLAELCRDFGTRLKAKKATIESQLPAFRVRPLSREGTAVHQIIRQLSIATDLKLIRAQAQVSEVERSQIEQVKRDLLTDPVKESQKLKARKKRIEELKAILEKSNEALLPKTTEGLRVLLQAEKDAVAAAKLAAISAFNKEPIPKAGSEIWKTLWEAARSFSMQEAYPELPFPNTATGAVCLLCQQGLSPESADRLQAFEIFVQKKVQQAVEDAKRAVQNRKEEIKRNYLSDEAFQEIIRFLREEVEQQQVRRDIVRNLAKARVRRRKLIADNDPLLTRLPSTAIPVSTQIEKILDNLDVRISELQKLIDPEQRKLQEKILRELEDRVWLASVLADIENEFERLKKLAAFDRAIVDTETNRITRKATEVSRELVTDRIRDAFAAEIAALSIADRRLELTQESSGYGSIKFKVSLIRNPRMKVAAVLSEGEHRCVALAAFLAELSTAHNQSGVIFDDPVSSLDHNYREAVASRLAKEAKNSRQVIVFTHDIPFLMMLDQEARKLGQTPHYQSVNRADDRSGICVSGAPYKAKSVPEIVAKLDDRLSTTSALHANGKLDEWTEQVKALAGFLRDGWERAAESYVAPVVQRYNNKVHPGELRMLTVLTDQDFEELSTGYQFACTYCHTDSAALNRPALVPATVKLEIDRLRNWFDSVKKRQEQKR